MADITGSDKKDVIFGTNGNDNIDGGPGGDSIDGRDGNDNIVGGDGEDLITGGGGSDTIEGEGDDDILVGDGPLFADITNGAANEGVFDPNPALPEFDAATAIKIPIFHLYSAPLLAYYLQPNGDLLYTGVVVPPGYSRDVPTMEDGGTLVFVNSRTGFIESVKPDVYAEYEALNPDGTTNNPVAPNRTQVQEDYIPADGAADTISGGDGDDIIYGQKGDDILDGGAGDDAISGGTENDTITGGDGDDYIGGEDGNDKLYGGAGVDGLFGGLGDDIIDGGDGNDAVKAGGGVDTITGGAGNDQVIAGSGNDVIDAGADDDVVNGGVGNDEIKGGEGNDYLDGGADSDTIKGGAGDDIIYGDLETEISSPYISFDYGLENWSLGNIIPGVSGGGQANPLAGEGQGPFTAAGSAAAGITKGSYLEAPFDDYFSPSLTFDVEVRVATQSGGGRPSEISPTGGSQPFAVEVLVDGVVVARAEDTTLEATNTYKVYNLKLEPVEPAFSNAPEGNMTFRIVNLSTTSNLDIDYIDVNAEDPDVTGGNDDLDGEEGADTVYGNIGNDKIAAAASDNLFGGADRDTFTITKDATATDLTIEIDGGTESTAPNDADDYDSVLWDTSTWKVVGGSYKATIDEEANPISGVGESRTGTIKITDGDQVLTINFKEIENIICFNSGTLIDTVNGKIEVEKIEIGDQVRTLRGEAKEVKWVGKRTFNKEQLAAKPKLYPVRISAGALGNGLPERDLLVSRQHRMMVRSAVTKAIVGTEEALIPAIKLTVLPGIYVDKKVDKVEYVHVLCDEHEVLLAEGAPSESLYLGENALYTFSDEALDEIMEIFPELGTFDFFYPSDYSLVDGPHARDLVNLHIKSQKTLVDIA